jgi:hypothetical protein
MNAHHVFKVDERTGKWNNESQRTPLIVRRFMLTRWLRQPQSLQSGVHYGRRYGRYDLKRQSIFRLPEARTNIKTRSPKLYDKLWETWIRVDRTCEQNVPIDANFDLENDEYIDVNCSLKWDEPWCKWGVDCERGSLRVKQDVGCIYNVHQSEINFYGHDIIRDSLALPVELCTFILSV